VMSLGSGMLRGRGWAVVGVGARFGVVVECKDPIPLLRKDSVPLSRPA
jgi:hypothetical protein